MDGALCLSRKGYRLAWFGVGVSLGSELEGMEGKERNGREWVRLCVLLCLSFWCAGLDNCVCISVGGERLSIPLL